MTGGPLRWAWLGRVPYGEALARQRARRRAIAQGHAPEALWLLEHPPVVTTGRRPAPGTPSRAALMAHGVALHATERGGLATYHAPGQLVAYVLVDLGSRGLAVRHLVARLEDAVIAWLASRGVSAGRRAAHPGVWVGPDKIAAIGLHVRRGVSLHGLALNLCPDLRGFGLIVPCGIQDGGVTSLAQQQGTAPLPADAAASFAAQLIASIESGATPYTSAHGGGACGEEFAGSGADPLTGRGRLHKPHRDEGM